MEAGGGSAGEDVHRVWQVSLSRADRDENKSFRLKTKCLNDLPIYQTRVKKATCPAIDVVHPSFINSKAVACAVYKSLTGDDLPSERFKGKDMTIRVIGKTKEIPYKRACGGHRVHSGCIILRASGGIYVELVLATEDFDIISDLRELNGRLEGNLFDAFGIIF